MQDGVGWAVYCLLIIKEVPSCIVRLRTPANGHGNTAGAYNAEVRGTSFDGGDGQRWQEEPRFENGFERDDVAGDGSVIVDDGAEVVPFDVRLHVCNHKN